MVAFLFSWFAGGQQFPPQQTPMEQGATQQTSTQQAVPQQVPMEQVPPQQGPSPIGELFAADGNAQVAGSGMSIVPGSELSAGIAPARLKLFRGGQVRICPRTSLTVNSGPSGLLLALNSGAIEIDYTLPPHMAQGGNGATVEQGTESDHGADVLITPDFNVRLAAPGTFHFALASNKQGDTCVRALAGNSESIEVSELLGSASYRIRPQESIRFHDFKLAGNVELLPNEACGCPETPAIMRAATAEPVNGQQQSQPAPAQTATRQNPPGAVAPEHSGQVQMQVEAPFVFSARDPAGVQPYSVAHLTLSTLPNLFFVQETVDPVVLFEEKPAVVSVRQEAAAPAATPERKPSEKKQRKGFFGKLKGFFGGLFGR